MHWGLLGPTRVYSRLDPPLSLFSPAPGIGGFCWLIKPSFTKALAECSACLAPPHDASSTAALCHRLDRIPDTKCTSTCSRMQPCGASQATVISDGTPDCSGQCFASYLALSRFLPYSFSENRYCFTNAQDDQGAPTTVGLFCNISCAK